MTQPHQMQQQQIVSGNTEARLGVVEARVGSIMEAIEGLSKKLDARSTINWAPISLLATVLIAFGTLGVGYLSTHQSRLEAMITKQDLRAERFVPREDLDKRFEVITQRRDDLQRLSDARVERIERDVDAIQKSVVPRGEHGEIWAGQRLKDEALQRQIDQVRKEVSDLNTPRDTVQSILRRLDELDRERRRPSEPR